MFGSTVLEIAIGLALVYLVASLICSTLAEIVARRLRLRPRTLRSTVARMLGEPPLDADGGWWLELLRPKPFATPDGKVQGCRPLTQDFFQHQLIASLTVRPERGPSYIPSRTFALTLLDLAAGERALPADASAEELRTTLRLGPYGGVGALQPLLGAATGAARTASDGPGVTLLEHFLRAVERWFNDAMERAGGEYKRRMQSVVLIASALTVVGLNIDTVAVVNALGRSETLRKVLVEQAAARVGQVSGDSGQGSADRGQESAAKGQSSGGDPPTEPTGTPAVTSRPAPDAADTPDRDSSAAANELQRSVDEFRGLAGLGLPLGWADVVWPAGPLWSSLPFFVFLKLGGWLASWMAISLGAPFWFDILGKLVNIRSGGARISTSTTGSAPPGTADTVGGAGHSGGTGGAAVPPSGVAVVRLQERATENNMNDFEHGSTGFSITNAVWLARAAKLAYESAADAESQLKSWGMTLVWPFDHAKTGTQGFVASNARIVLLAFRGTEPKEIRDVLSDAMFLQGQGLFGDDRVHSGFSKALNDEVWKSIAGTLADFQSAGQTLWITGHSLGAALATLAAARLALAGRPVQGVYTFGSPRVGDEKFRTAYDQRLKTRTFRFVNQQDVVTRVPPWKVENYRHVGIELYFNEAGRMVVDPSGWFWQVLDTALQAIGDLKQLKGDAFKDHSMELYRRQVEREFERTGG